MKTKIEIPKEQKLRLIFLDGIRGFAAFYVVLSHIYLQQSENLPAWINLPTKLFRYGSFSVAVFIVLSGYSLMLPVVRSQTGYLPGTLLDYFKRRAKRIISPYYITLFFCCLLALIILSIEQFTALDWQEFSYDWFSPHFSFVDLFLHILMIHNLNPEKQLYLINLPLWSVALEWQIYFLFPLLFLPIWRRWGGLSVIIVAFVIGLIPHYLLNGYMDAVRPWFVGAFTIGMIGAEIGFSQKSYLIHLRKSCPWGKLAIIFAGLAIFTQWEKIRVDAWMFETFASIAAACLIIHCTQIVMEGKKRGFILRLFEHSWALKLGGFSYSLYLTHARILTVVRHLLMGLNIPSVISVVIFYLVGLGLSLLIAYRFHLLFEKPFMPNFSTNTRKWRSLS